MSLHKKPRHTRRTTSEGTLRLSTPLRATLFALPVTLLVGLLLLLGATALLLSTKDPDRYHRILSLPMLYLTAFLGGMIAARFAHRRAPFLCGTALGILLAVLFSLLALLLPDTLSANSAGYLKFLLRLVVIPASLLGAVLGAREKKRKHPRHR